MIVSLARANLIHDWRRHATAIMVLVLAGLLMTIQLGFVAGFMESYTAMQRQVRAEIIVEGDSRSGFGRGFRRGGSVGAEERHEGAVWMHPDVVNVKGYGLFDRNAMATLDDESQVRISVTIIDPGVDSLTYPLGFADSLREVLATPGMIVLPRASKREMNLELGETLVIGGNEVTVGGIVNGLPGSFSARIFASEQTAQLIGAGGGGYTNKFLVKISDPQKADQVIAELNMMLAPLKLKAMRPSESASGRGFEEIFRGPGLILLGSAVFALLVGCGIASQTLRGAFLAQIKEFGSLRALGVRKRHLAWIAMEQAWWTGLVSVPIAAIIAYGIQAVAEQYDVAIALPANLMIGSSILLLIVALLAGLISLTAVTRAEPAELLR